MLFICISFPLFFLTIRFFISITKLVKVVVKKKTKNTVINIDIDVFLFENAVTYWKMDMLYVVLHLALVKSRRKKNLRSLF